VQIGTPVLPPPGDARQDLWIIQEIAKRLGLDWNYSGPAEVFAELAKTMPSFNNITWERVVREGSSPIRLTPECPRERHHIRRWVSDGKW